jgi:hypothetical protein
MERIIVLNGFSDMQDPDEPVILVAIGRVDLGEKARIYIEQLFLAS